jgi:hypothetical protein
LVAKTFQPKLFSPDRCIVYFFTRTKRMQRSMPPTAKTAAALAITVKEDCHRDNLNMAQLDRVLSLQNDPGLPVAHSAFWEDLYLVLPGL